VSKWIAGTMLAALVLAMSSIAFAETYVVCITPKLYKDRTLKCYNCAGPYKCELPRDQASTCKGKGKSMVFNSESDANDGISLNACGRLR
jgi:hypothetical protein